MFESIHPDDLHEVTGGIDFPEPNMPGPWRPELGPTPDRIIKMPAPPGPGTPIPLPGGGVAK